MNHSKEYAENRRYGVLQILSLPPPSHLAQPSLDITPDPVIKQIYAAPSANDDSAIRSFGVSVIRLSAAR